MWITKMYLFTFYLLVLIFNFSTDGQLYVYVILIQVFAHNHVYIKQFSICTKKNNAKAVLITSGCKVFDQFYKIKT